MPSMASKTVFVQRGRDPHSIERGVHDSGNQRTSDLRQKKSCLLMGLRSSSTTMPSPCLLDHDYLMNTSMCMLDTDCSLYIIEIRRTW